MALAESTMLKLGTVAPGFRLPEVVSGRTVSLADFKDKTALLVMFICRHCPYVQHLKGELARIGREYASKSLGIVAISSNDAEAYQDDSPARLAALVREESYTFPVCYDETQSVALAYTAACTPDFFVFDRARRLAYRGQLDDSRPGNGKPVSGHDLRAALDAVLAGTAVPAAQRPSVGCNIKWKPGLEPDYFRK